MSRWQQWTQEPLEASSLGTSAWHSDRPANGGDAHTHTPHGTRRAARASNGRSNGRCMASLLAAVSPVSFPSMRHGESRPVPVKPLPLYPPAEIGLVFTPERETEPEAQADSTSVRSVTSSMTIHLCVPKFVRACFCRCARFCFLSSPLLLLNLQSRPDGCVAHRTSRAPTQASPSPRRSCCCLGTRCSLRSPVRDTITRAERSR